MSKPQLYLLKPFAPKLEVAAQKGLDGFDQISVISATYEELARAVAQQPFGLVVAHIVERKDGVQLVQLLKAMRPRLVSMHWMVLVVTPFKQQVFKDKLLNYGCAEVMNEPIHEKSLQFKIRRFMQSILGKTDEKQTKATEVTKKSKWIGAGASPKKPEAVRSVTKKPRVEWLPPLETADDVWSLKGGSARFYRAKWEIRLRGPSKTRGHWVKMPGGSDDHWQWEFFDAKDQTSKGLWRFRGPRPGLDSGYWVFVGLDVELAFVLDGAVQHRKFFMQDGSQLMIAQDGKQSVLVRERITESSTETIEPRIRISREAGAVDVDLESQAVTEVKPIQEVVQETLDAPDHDDLKALREDVAPIPQAQEVVVEPDLELQWVLKREVPGPALSATAMAFLMTEWMARIELSQRDCLAKICRYLAASLGRASVEIWKQDGQAWQRMIAQHTGAELIESTQIDAALGSPGSNKPRVVELRGIEGTQRYALVISGGRSEHPTVAVYLEHVRDVVRGAITHAA